MTEPRFRHSCPKCVFLGTHEDADLYYCAQGGRPTVLARNGDEPPDYISGLFAADVVPSLQRARELARERGLLP